ERACGHRHDADFDVRRRIAPRDLLAQPQLLRRIISDDECNSDHGTSLFDRRRMIEIIRGMVPGERFELPTNGLQNRCSTTELTRRMTKKSITHALLDEQA